MLCLPAAAQAGTSAQLKKAVNMVSLYETGLAYLDNCQNRNEKIEEEIQNYKNQARVVNETFVVIYSELYPERSVAQIEDMLNKRKKEIYRDAAIDIDLKGCNGETAQLGNKHFSSYSSDTSPAEVSHYIRNAR